MSNVKILPQNGVNLIPQSYIGDNYVQRNLAFYFLSINIISFDRERVGNSKITIYVKIRKCEMGWSHANWIIFFLLWSVYFAPVCTSLTSYNFIPGLNCMNGRLQIMLFLWPLNWVDNRRKWSFLFFVFRFSVFFSKNVEHFKHCQFRSKNHRLLFRFVYHKALLA